MATASPSKRQRSPEHSNNTFTEYAPPAKLTHSPSTRDSTSSFLSTVIGSNSSNSNSETNNHSMATMMDLTGGSHSYTSTPSSSSASPAFQSSAVPTSSASGAHQQQQQLHHQQHHAVGQSAMSSGSNGNKLHQRSATTPAGGSRIFSDSPSSMHAPQPHMPSPSLSAADHPSHYTRFASPHPTSSAGGAAGVGNSNYRIASHSGSTTSAFSGGSVGSSYDGGNSSSMTGVNNSNNNYNAYDDGSSSNQHGLGVLVQGPNYGLNPSSSSSSSATASYQASASAPRSQHVSPAHHHASQPRPPPATAAAQQYYNQPYGYQSGNHAVQAPFSSMNLSSSSPSSYQQHTSQVPHMQSYTSSGHTPHPLSQSHHQSGPFPSISSQHRRSIAGQSAGGSSYHSGASASPTAHRRSDDMMDGTFISAVNTSGGPPSSALSSVPYSTPITEASSPAHPHKTGWSPPAYAPGGGGAGGNSTISAPGSATMSNANIPSPAIAGFIDPSVRPSGNAGSDSPASQSQFAQAHSYQSIVDDIMNQTRKATDYGLDLGDFEMLDTLGTGTFGRVLLVRLHPKASGAAGLAPGIPHYFAMKVLAKTEVVRLKQVEHINCERSILGAVDHPGIVNLFCTFQDSLNIYMLLEFVQGGELFSHLRRAVRFSADVTRFYAANIILVLEYLHNRNLIYRDLKPENLLLDAHGYLKVTDFGFAKYVPDRTFTLCGTPEYLAPEIINSAGHGKAADWWAFGVLLFEMLCGYPPFFDESPWGIYEKILAGNFSFPPHVDPVARDLIRRLLSSDRSKRLGNLRSGAMDVKNHQWFEGVDWAAVEGRLIPAPIVPRIKSTSDSQNFERYPSIPIETLPGLARAKGIPVHEEPDPYEHMFVHF